MPQSLSALYVHIVFSTKGRSPFLSQLEFQNAVHAYLGGIVNGQGCQPICIGGVANHVHLLVRLSRTVAVADLVRDLKGNSGRWIKENRPELRGFSWQGGYGAFSAEQASIPGLISYIENQEEHHRKLSFEDEYRALLRSHDVVWDEKYVWE